MGSCVVLCLDLMMSGQPCRMTGKNKGVLGLGVCLCMFLYYMCLCVCICMCSYTICECFCVCMCVLYVYRCSCVQASTCIQGPELGTSLLKTRVADAWPCQLASLPAYMLACLLPFFISFFLFFLFFSFVCSFIFCVNAKDPCLGPQTHMADTLLRVLPP